MSTKISTKQELHLSESKYKQLLKMSARRMDELERIGTSQKNTQEAMLNVMEDLESAKSIIEVEKAKDEAMLASIGEGVIAVDTRGRIIMINSVAEEMLGWEAGQLKGKLISQFRLEDEKGNLVPIHKRPTKIALSTSKSIRVNYFFVKKDKTRFPVFITVTPIKLEGKTIGLIEIMRDITHELELDKAKDEFISLASHQLRGPITSISWSLEGLLSQYEKDFSSDQKERLSKILEISRGMGGLVGGFLDITRMETLGFVVKKGKVILVDSCNFVIDELAGQILEKKIQLIKKFDKKIPLSNIGEKTASTIFQNLLTNAIKYSAENAKIEVSIIKVHNGIEISVKDNGFGIPDKAKPFIFTKLFRADNAKEKEPSGTGLGLYLVKSLLDRVGGGIKFESKEGVGTTFCVNLKT